MNELPRNFDKKELHIGTCPTKYEKYYQIYYLSKVWSQYRSTQTIDMHRNVIYDEIVITNNLGKMGYIISCIAGILSEFTNLSRHINANVTLNVNITNISFKILIRVIGQFCTTF